VRFAVVGLSHKTAPIELRERFAKHTKDLAQALQELIRLEFVQEACVVSTCNRVEFYVAGSAEAKMIARSLRTHLTTFSGLPPEGLEPHLYQHLAEEGLRHLFRVASSLDSMVLGEPQILGQVKEAYRACTEVGTNGPQLDRAFQRAFNVAKRIRTETGIAENAVSMSFAAVELGREIFDTLEGKEVLLLGAGKMGTLAAKHLMAYGVTRVRVASRTLGTAQKLAEEIGGSASSLEDLPLLLHQADIVICSTAAPTYVVDKRLMKKVVRERRYRPILFVDIAVPRDVDPSVADLDNVFVYDVDDLESVLELNRENRAGEAAAAEKLVADELENYLRWSKSQQVVPVIKALRMHASQIAELEIQRTLQNVKEPDKKTSQSVKAMGNAIVNKLLHPVLTRLKQEGAHGDPQPLIDALVALFELDLQIHEPVEKEEAESADNVVQFPQRDQG
jgi:glutamyl-tRNA reductase